MKLSIAERIVIGSILPRENTFITLKVVRKLRDALSFTEKELKQFEIKEVGPQITWSKKVSKKEVEIEIGERATDVIEIALKKLDETKKLENKHFTLYEKFVEKKTE